MNSLYSQAARYPIDGKMCLKFLGQAILIGIGIIVTFTLLIILALHLLVWFF